MLILLLFFATIVVTIVVLIGLYTPRGHRCPYSFYPLCKEFLSFFLSIVVDFITSVFYGDLVLLLLLLLLMLLMRFHVVAARDVLYMPVATYFPNLIKITVDALKAKHAQKTLEEARVQVPSPSWVYLQFSPKNRLSSNALNYTGALNLKHKVQQRTLRAHITDAHYVATAKKYMRSYGVWLHEQLREANRGLSVISASFDDKCKVLPPSLLQY